MQIVCAHPSYEQSWHHPDDLQINILICQINPQIPVGIIGSGDADLMGWYQHKSFYPLQPYNINIPHWGSEQTWWGLTLLSPYSLYRHGLIPDV